MSLKEMPIDIVDNFCQAIVEKENQNNPLNNAKKYILDKIVEKNLIEKNLTNIYQIEDIIYEYVRTLTQDQVNKIITNYGINKGLILLHEWYSGKMGFTSDEFCMEITDTDISIDRNIVENIVMYEIGGSL